MRLIKQSLFLMLLSFVTIASCKKDDDGGETGPAAEGTIQASIDGKAFTSLSMVTFATKVSAGGSNIISFQGNNGGTSSQAIVFTLNGITETGTYEIGGKSSISIVASYTETKVSLSNPGSPDISTWQAPYDDTVAGEIKISELSDSKIVGTFHFKGKNTLGDSSVKEVKSGSFNIKFTR